MKIKNNQLDSRKVVILLTVLVDVLGIGIVIPVLPFYVESFGVSAVVLTLLFSVFSLFSFVSAPMLGALSDKIGRRPVLIISIASTAVGWFVFAWAHSIWMLFLGRIIDGMAAGNLPVAESYLVDIARDEKERTKNLGLIGAVFGAGFVVGPAIGASLTAISTVLPFYVVGSLAFLNMIAAIIFLPETNLDKNKHKKISLNPWRPIANAIGMKPLRSRFAAWFLFGIAIAGMQAIFALYVKDVFGFSAQMTGLLFAGMGAFMILNQTVFLNRFWLKRFSEDNLEIWLFLLFALGFVLLGVPVLIIFLLGILFNMMARSVLRIVISSRVAGIAGKEKRGEIMGTMASIMALANIGGPVMAGMLFETRNYLPFMMSSFVLVLAFAVMKFCCVKPEDNAAEDIQSGLAEAL